LGSAGVTVILATTSAPSSVLRISTSPPRRRQMSLVKASPIPRSPSCAALVVKPCSKTSGAMVESTPGPES
jgi:hypothetical protein